MTIIRSNNFESGVAAGTVIDATNSAVGGNAFNQIDGTPKYTATKSHGALGLDCTGNAVAAMVSWNNSMSTKTYQFASDIYIEAAPSATGQMFTARNASNYVLGLNLTTARKLAVTHWGGAAQYTSTTVLALNTWYRWELWGEVKTTGTGEIHFALFLRDSTTPLETFDMTTADLQSTVIVTPRQGKHSTSGTMSLIIDDFRAGDVNAPLGPPANVPPTVTVSANQNVAAATTATVTSSATDADGTVVSTVWSFVYPSSGAPTLTGGTTANASFTTGAAGSLYILRCTVTDDVGATASATTEVRVPTTSDLTPLPIDGTGTGTWTRAGGAANDGAALADALDSTYVESPTATATEANRRFRLTPTTTRSSAVIKIRVSQSDAGTITVTARLYDGTTLRQSWTVPVTTSFVENSLTLSSGTLAAIADWGNLSLELAVTT